MDFSNHKFRPSSLGKLMAGVKPNLTAKQEETLLGLLEKKESGKITDKQITTLGDLIKKRDAKPTLSSGAKTYIDEIFQEIVFGRSKVIETKYMDKGLMVEDVALTLYQEVTGTYVQKNEERIKNDYVIGTPDSIVDKIIDIKSSWESTTFPLIKDQLNTIYDWQVRAYMWLTGLNNAEVAYCLVDTPYKLIEDELRRMDWKHDILDLNGSVRKERIPLVVEMIERHIYTKDGLRDFCADSSSVEIEWFTNFKEITKEHRVRIYEVEHCDEKIEQIKTQIELARDYLNSITISLVA